MKNFTAYCCLWLILASITCAQFQTYMDIIKTGLVKNNRNVHRKLVDYVHHNFNPYGENSLLHTLGDWPAVLKSGVESLKEGAKDLVNDESKSLSEDPQSCLDDIMTFLNHSTSSWGLQMLDSFGKPGSGIINGNLFWLGDFEQCRAVKPIINETIQYDIQKIVPFDTQYCLNALPLPIPGLKRNPMSPYGVPILALGLCVPNTCSGSEIADVINEGIRTLSGQNITLDQVICQPESIEIDNWAKGAICVFGVLGFFILLGTVYDVFLQVETSCVTVNEAESEDYGEKLPLIGKKGQNHSGIAQFLLCFSLYTNGKKLLSTNVAAGSLTSINGIRFLSMTWVVLGHAYYLIQNIGSNSAVVLQQWIDRWTFSAIDNALVCVDTFFTLSGLLVSYLLLKDMKKKNSVKINWPMFYFHRFWRLTPAYMLFILHSTAIARYYGDGPNWPSKDGFDPGCKTSWWRNLLYINNFFSNANENCYGVSWYLANDMQFYILSPILIIPFFWSAISGLVMNLIWLLGIFIATGLIASHYELPVSIFDLNSPMAGSLQYMDKYYVKPWCRMGPYIVGVVTGYLLYRCEGKLKMNKFVAILGWVIATVLACTILYGLSGHPDLSNDVKALYNTTHRTLWGACVCWVIFACATGNGGFINTLLSWKPFLPLGRLTYCAYLTHFLLIQIFMSYSRVPVYLTDLTMIYIFLAAITGTMLLAFVASLAFESPMMGLEKMLLNRGKRH